MDGTNLMMQGHLYNRNTQMPPPTLADLRTYHYGSPTIEESPAAWFVFDSGTGTITGFNYVEGREDVVIPWEIGGVAVEAIGEMAFSPDFSGTPVETLIGPKTLWSIGESAFYYCISLTSVYFGTAKPTEGVDMFSTNGGPINVTIYYPTGASAWSGVTTWGGKTTAPYTPPAP